jgi:hypothetical protein
VEGDFCKITFSAYFQKWRGQITGPNWILVQKVENFKALKILKPSRYFEGN